MNELKDEFVPYKESFQLSNLGIELESFGFYNNADPNVWVKQEIPEELKNIYTGDIQAPTYSQAFNWFRELGYDFSNYPRYKDLGKFYGGGYSFGKDGISKSYGSNFQTYREAELALLKCLINDYDLRNEDN
jgi:hypothetical protein